MSPINWDQFDIVEEPFRSNKGVAINWNDFEKIEPQKQENLSSNEAIRHGIRSISRGAETIAGLPGDISSLIGSAIGLGAEKLYGSPLPELREAFERGPSLVKGDEFVPEAAPSSLQLRQSLGKASKGFTEPRNEVEAVTDEFISDFTGLLFPVGGEIKLLRSLGSALAGTLGKQSARLFGGETGAQEAGKLGGLFLSGLMARPSADKFVSGLYSSARASIPKEAKIETSSLVKGLQSVENELKKGVSTSTKKQVLSNVKELKNKASKGPIAVDDLLQSYHDINETLASKKLFDELSKSEQRLARRRFETVKTEIGKALGDYGKHNPKFINNWRSANEAYAVIQKSKKVSDWIRKAIKAKPTLLATPAIALFEAMNPSTFLPTISAAGAGYGLIKSGELLSRVARSPTLRKYYVGILKSAIQDNQAGVVRGLIALNRNLPQSKED